MPRILLVFLFALPAGPLYAAAPVAFDATVAAYEDGQHEAARTAFRRMAEAGMPEAQFNLGVMTLNGQGGPADRVEAALWIRLAADTGYEPARDAMEIVREHLDDGQREQFESDAPEWSEKYARSVLLERFRPEICRQDCAQDSDGMLPGTHGALHEPDSGGDGVQQPEQDDASEVVITLHGVRASVHRSQPHYPREAAENAVMGRVRLGGWVNSAGEIEQPHVVASYPDDEFDRAALRAFSNWRMEWLDQPPEELPTYISQKIVFTLDQMSNESMPNGGRTQRELQSAIEQGQQDLAASHKAIWMVEELELPVRQSADVESVITVIHQAAQAGVDRAQFDLGRRLAYGDDVRKHTDGAMYWLKQAAFEGHSEAQFELSRWDRIDADFRRDLRRAAAAAGLTAAILWEIRDQVADPGQADAAYLAKLLEQLPRRWRSRDDDPVIARAREIAESA